MNRLIPLITLALLSSAGLGAVTLDQQIQRRGEYAYFIAGPSNNVLLSQNQVDEDIVTTDFHEALVVGAANTFGLNLGARGVWDTSYSPAAPSIGSEVTSMHFDGETMARMNPTTSGNTGQANGIAMSRYVISVDRDTAARFTGAVAITATGDAPGSGFFVFSITKVSGGGPETPAYIYLQNAGFSNLDQTFTLQAGATYRVQVQALTSLLEPGTADTIRIVGVHEARLDFTDLAIPGDTNADDAVDFADLNAVLSTFGQTGAGLQGDLDADGTVGFLDLNEVLSNFGDAAD